MNDYNDLIWMNYVKKYDGVYPLSLLSKHDGFVIDMTYGFLIPYSIDNQELMIVFTEEFRTSQEKGYLYKRIAPFTTMLSWDSFILPEKNLKYVAVLLGLDTK